MVNFDLRKLEKDDLTEYLQLSTEMADNQESNEVALKGQKFHQKIQDKYGKSFAMQMTEAMFDTVAEIRFEGMLRHYMIHEATGEVII